MTLGSGFLTSPPRAKEPHSPPEQLNSPYLGRVCSLIDGCLVLLMAGTAFALGCQELSDADVWWHVRSGQWIWQNRRVPMLDPFSFASADRPWIDLHWLFQVLLAAVFAAGGVRGIILMAAVGWTAVVLVALTAAIGRWPVWIATACWLPALVVMSARFTPRPEVFSLLGVALYLTVLLHADDKPGIAWILPIIQVLWVNAHGLFVLGPAILVMYLADRLVSRTPEFPIAGSKKHSGRYRWWGHVGGAAVLVGLACLANPYGLRGALFPLELFPKITAWGGQYKAYIIEFGNLKDFVRKQGFVATGSPYLRAECFLFWATPLSFIVPAVWRTGRLRISSSAWNKGCIGALGLAVGLVLTSALSLPAPGTPAAFVRLGRLAPLGLVALGALSAAIVIRSSRWTALLAMIGGINLAMWVLWLQVHLLGLEPGMMGLFLIENDSAVLGWCTALIGGVMAVLVFRAGGRFVSIVLSLTFGYLALQAIRNMSLFGLAAGFVTTRNLGEWAAELMVEPPAQNRRSIVPWVKEVTPRVVIAGVAGLLIFTIVSGRTFGGAGEPQRLGLRERPLLYAHDAARFAAAPGLPDRALAFDLTQASVYVFHNGPERKIFMDGRLEIPTRETFQTYVRLENMLNEGRQSWAERIHRMGDPLIVLDHKKEFGAEATLLRDPEWRCVYYDAVASVFLSRRRGLETSFPSVDFLNRHFHDPEWQAIPPIPWGLAEAKGLLDLGSALQYRDRLTGPLPLSLRLLACDRFRQAIAPGSNHRGVLDLAGDCLLEHGPRPDGLIAWNERSLGHCDRSPAGAGHLLLPPRART